jgi:hypothetical protein
MRLIGGLLLSVLLLLIGTRTADAKSAWSDVAWGVTVGNPQWVALTLETYQNAPVRLHARMDTTKGAGQLSHVQVASTEGGHRDRQRNHDNKGRSQKNHQRIDCKRTQRPTI